MSIVGDFEQHHGLSPIAALNLDSPHNAYASLRRESPVYWDHPTRKWYVTRHSDVVELLLDDRLRATRSSTRDSAGDGAASADAIAVERFLARWPVFSEPPLQEIVRRALIRSMAQRKLETSRAAIGHTCERLVNGRGPLAVDLVADIARPATLSTLATILGTPQTDSNLLQEWSDGLLGYLNAPVRDATVIGAASRAASDLTRYVQDVILPGQGAISSAFGSLVASGAIDVSTTAASVAQIVTGSIDPICASAVVAASELRRNPALYQRAKAKQISVSSIAEEAFRLEAPFHFAPRVASSSIRVAGEDIKAGDKVTLVLSSANRDSLAFDRPDVYDPRRSRGINLVFGRGRHYCVGAALARAHLEAIVEAILDADLIPALDPSGVERVACFGATLFRRAQLDSGFAK